MKKSLLLTATVLVALPGIAKAPEGRSTAECAVISESAYLNPDNARTPKEDALSTSSSVSTMAHRHKPSREEVELVPITVTLSYVPMLEWDYTDKELVVFNDEYIEYIDFEEDDIPLDPEAEIRTVSQEVMVPSTGAWIAINESGGLEYFGTVLLVKHVDPAETSEVTLSPSEATNLMKFRMVTEDGQEIKPTQGHWTEDGTPVITSLSNITSVDYMAQVSSHGWCFSKRNSNTDYVLDEHNPRHAQFQDIWTNYSGDELSVVFECFYERNDGTLYCGAGSATFAEENMLLTNDPATFITLNPEKIRFSPEADVAKWDHIYSAEILRSEPGLGWSRDSRTVRSDGVAKVSMFKDQLDNVFFAARMQRPEGEQQWVKLLQTCSPYCFPPEAGDDEWKYAITPFMNYFMDFSDQSVPDNEWAVFEPERVAADFGTGPSFIPMSMQSFPYWEDANVAIFYLAECMPTGLLGDTRYFSQTLLRWDVGADGEAICSNADDNQVYDALMNRIISNPSTQTLSLTTHNTNQTLGTTPAVTTSTASISYNGNETWVPTITTVNIFNAEGKITYDLDSAEGATLVVGGVSLWYASERGLLDTFNYAPVNLEAWYSPAGCEEWTELTLEPKGDGIVKGIGSLATANLAVVDKPSSEGLFDLRVRVTDSNGSTHENVISPAFHVAELGSIEAIAAGAKDIEGIYNLQGIRQQHPTPGLVIVRYTDGTSAKVMLR